MPAPLVSPFPAIVKEVLEIATPTTRGLITATARGRVLEVTVVAEHLILTVGDAVLIELLPASKQWVVVPFIR